MVVGFVISKPVCLLLDEMNDMHLNGTRTIRGP